MNNTAHNIELENTTLDCDRPTNWLVEHLDSDTVIVRSEFASCVEPEDWREHLCRMLKNTHGAAAVGAKRLNNAGRIHSMGEFIIHPKGYHSLGKELPGHVYRFPEEVDVISGGVIAMDRQFFDKVGGIDLLNGDLGALQLSLAFRLAGGKCITIPEVITVDSHELNPTEEEEARFKETWDFNWRSADMEKVQCIYKGTGLLWNVRFHGESMPFCKYKERPSFHWQSYCEVDIFRERADRIMQIVMQFCKKGKLLDLGCGDGLYTHIAALCGADATGIEIEEEAVLQARTLTAAVKYPDKAPSFIIGDGGHLQFPDESFDIVIMLDVIEHLHNPVRVLRDLERVTKKGGFLFITTPLWRFDGWSDAVYHICEYSPKELTNQIEATTSLTVIEKGLLSKTCRDIFVVCQKKE